MAEGRLIDEEGRAWVPLVVRHNPAFAALCLRIWRERDGRDRRYLLQANALNVPVEVLEAARSRAGEARP